ncbi:hypothetical protein OEZ85_011201 [Tetradesmus obliquus]|uniref:Increased DNA methylation 1 C-terminal domain-containing protein n=1 Tax=Tetradesmus obliquus TaxID=3088 RepID=A0ABY8TPJ7_TETOB|nr:hypothetical protein OEZ85_011201 [Tetradesmus obliquus]
MGVQPGGGGPDPANRGARTVVEAAIKIFKDSFGTMMMPNGQDYIAMCCRAYESPDPGPDASSSSSDDSDDSDAEQDEQFDFSGFRVVALRRGPLVVSVATLRLFGTSLAEMPYVATRKDARRAGNCRRLLKGVEDMLRRLRVAWLVLPSVKQGVEDMLRRLRVAWLVLPSVKQVLGMWRHSFNFMPLTLQELAALESHIISPDFGTVQLLKKRMWPPLAALRGGTGRGSRAGGAAAAAAAAGGGRGGKRRKGRRPSKKKRKAGKGKDHDDWEGAASDSSSSDSDNDLVASDDDEIAPEEDEGDFVRSRKQQQQQQRKALPGAAATPANSAGTAGTSSAAAAQQGAQPTQQELDAALAWLAKEVAKAGGSLGEGWTAQLSARRPNGKWGNRRFVAPDGTVCCSAPQVKRHLGLEDKPGAASPAALPSVGRQLGLEDTRGGLAGLAGKALRRKPPDAIWEWAWQGRALRRKLRDTTLGVGLAVAVKKFYNEALQELVTQQQRQGTDP